MCDHLHLVKVLTLRTVHEQLVRLLSAPERQQLRTSEAFLPFAGLNPLHHNPYTQPLWRAAVTQYERGMAPAEQRIAGKLRQQFRDLAAQSHQVCLNMFNILGADHLTFEGGGGMEDSDNAKNHPSPPSPPKKANGCPLQLLSKAQGCRKYVQL